MLFGQPPQSLAISLNGFVLEPESPRETAGLLPSDETGSRRMMSGFDEAKRSDEE
jgi:hypothetical protein